MRPRFDSVIYVEAGRDASMVKNWDPVEAQRDTVVHEVGHAVAN